MAEPTHLWAKIRRQTPRDESSPITDWLPLEHHSADVAAVFEALLRLPGFRARADRLLGLEMGDIHIARLSVFAYLHDIGKGNAGFQSKVMPPGQRHRSAPAGHVREAVCLVGEPLLLGIMCDHLQLKKMLSWFEGVNDDPFNELQQMLVAAWSHHGKPLAFEVSQLDSAASRVWESWRWSSPEKTMQLFGRQLAEHYSLAFQDTTPFPASPRFQAFFAGLLSTADWIGSSETWFGFHAHGSESRMAWSRRRAHEIVAAMGMDARPARAVLQTRPGDYNALFGFSTPNPMQALVQELSMPDRDGSILLIESETGSGKTEAALAHAMRLYRADLVDGVYFALPTRTSGVQIHARLNHAVQRAFGPEAAPPVLLAIPGYGLPTQTATPDPLLLPQDGRRWDDELPGGRALARSWYTENSKRYLAAPFAAGTVDQLLLSCLRNKHAHMRASSTSRSLLVIDEVHASDDYMTQITTEVVRRHVAAGGHVVLMSATLGAEAARAYMGGLPLELAQAQALPYPLLRWSRGKPARMQALQIPAAEVVADKQVSMQTHEGMDDHAGIAAIAAMHAGRGARVLVIRNTVGACTQTREILDGLLDEDHKFKAGSRSVHSCHHGRFAPQDRRLLDRAVEAEFGKARPGGGMVLVATQTVEQSLDIDADILITDLCPMDVLLQRIGRLHRHDRTGQGDLAARPALYQRAVCVVITPHQTVTLTQRSASGMGIDRAYQDVRIVELTLRQILAHPEFRIPGMNRMLVESCVHSQAKTALESEDERWRLHAIRVDGRGIADRASARGGLVCIDSGFGTRAQFDGWADEARITTRIGASPLSAVFPAGQVPRSPFDRAELKVISIPQWMSPPGLANTGDDVVPILLEQHDDRFAFEFGGQRYDYDCDGLSKTTPPKRS